MAAPYFSIPALRKLRFVAGDTLNAVFVFSDVDSTTGTETVSNLTGYSAKFSIKTAAGVLLAQFTSAAGTLVVGTTDGTITFAVPASTTAAYTAGDYLYDMELTSGAGVVSTPLEPADLEIVAGVS